MEGNKMKMEFMKPQIEVIEMSTEVILMTSVSSKGDFDIDYGGIDENGEYDPE